MIKKVKLKKIFQGISKEKKLEKMDIYDTVMDFDIEFYDENTR